MKRLTTKMGIGLIAMLTLLFSSCDDERIANTLEGTWEGNMYVSSIYNGRTYDATYSKLCFLRDPYAYTSGTGYWIDYYNTYAWGRNYVANHIEWRVVNGEIRVYFVEENYVIYINNYRLNDRHFVGTLRDGNNLVDFDLIHTSSPNWDTFEWGWDYGYAKPTLNETHTDAPQRIFRSNK